MIVAAELKAEVQGTLERTGGAVLLDQLGEVSAMDREHSERVGDLAMHVVAETGGKDADVVRAGISGRLHDIGKVDPEVQKIISLPRDLTPEERLKSNRIHTELGASMIRGLKTAEEDRELVEEAAEVALYHHHRPRQLSALMMSTALIRRIRIIDQFDAMQDASRPYHLGSVLSPAETLSLIEALLKDQYAFDNLAATTVRILKKGTH